MVHVMYDLYHLICVCLINNILFLIPFSKCIFVHARFLLNNLFFHYAQEVFVLLVISNLIPLSSETNILN